jgi:hypothetical protein
MPERSSRSRRYEVTRGSKWVPALDRRFSPPDSLQQWDIRSYRIRRSIEILLHHSMTAALLRCIADVVRRTLLGTLIRVSPADQSVYVLQTLSTLHLRSFR